MKVRLFTLVFVATFINPTILVGALSASEIPADTPISSLLSSANAHLAKGELQDALTYYDIAIQRDPKNVLSLFKRGAAYLSLGRQAQAEQDFDKVLDIRPDHVQARRQRAKIRGRNGNWDGAKEDYNTLGTANQELAELSEAQGAASLAADAEKNKDWEDCITQTGAAILVASKLVSLRRTRAHCRFERGEVEEGISDLKHILQMQPGLIEPHIQISAISFYALGDVERGLDQMRKCLHSDPESKSCKKLYRRQKVLEKQIGQANKFFEKKHYASGLKLLNPTGEDPGLLQELKDDVMELRETGTFSEHTPNNLVLRTLEMVCEAYHEGKNYKKANPACNEALGLNGNSLYGILHKAHNQMEAESYEAAMATLNKAKEHHADAQEQINHLMQNAQTELKRSKTKDYYKLLGLQRDADELQIKSAYRKMVKVHHPDKAHKLGITKEEAEKKMASVNEAYEVLSNPELKARFDRGDDPNDQQQQRAHPFQQGGNPFRGNPFFQQGGGGQQFSFKFTGGGFQFG